MDKFILGKNPLRKSESQPWIIHLLEPHAMIRVTKGGFDTYFQIYREDKYAKEFTYNNLDGTVEKWTLGIYHSTIYQNAPLAVKLLNKAWRWYRECLEKAKGMSSNTDVPLDHLLYTLVGWQSAVDRK